MRMIIICSMNCRLISMCSNNPRQVSWDILISWILLERGICEHWVICRRRQERGNYNFQQSWSRIVHRTCNNKMRIDIKTFLTLCEYCLFNFVISSNKWWYITNLKILDFRVACIVILVRINIGSWASISHWPVAVEWLARLCQCQ